MTGCLNHYVACLSESDREEERIVESPLPKVNCSDGQHMSVAKRAGMLQGYFQ